MSSSSSSAFPLRILGRRQRASMKSKNSDSDDIPILVNVGVPGGDSSGDSSGSPYASGFVQSFDNDEEKESEKQSKLGKIFFGKRERVSRAFRLDGVPRKTSQYPKNAIRNQKYTMYNFLFIILFNQFKYFLNMYFLVVAMSQLIPELKVGILYTYFAPLAFVLTVTIAKEVHEDYQRYKRDKEANSQLYERLSIYGFETIPSHMINVGDVIRINRNQRVPADVILLQTSDQSGTCFIRTDQLDGETDWKLRIAVPTFQKVNPIDNIFSMNSSVYAEKPHKGIYDFVGTINIDQGEGPVIESLNLENTLWANTVVASGSAIGCVVYTGAETKAMINTSQPDMKMGRVDLELNSMTKILFLTSIILSGLLVGFSIGQAKGSMAFSRALVLFSRFVILFSNIIPIGLRINLDMARTVYAYLVNNDKQIPGSIMRNSNLPEELGRVEYLLTDKTGTLTKNEMEMKKLHLGTICFGVDTSDEVVGHLETVFDNQKQLSKGDTGRRAKGRRDISNRTKEIIQALALCHNVTPVTEDGVVTYQASSPDEISIVKWTENVGLTLVKRELDFMQLRSPHGDLLDYEILHVFPFTSELKRMGIIIRDRATGEITFYQKGADSIMSKIVQYNDWLEEECGNMAREGLRTLVIGKKRLSEEALLEFDSNYQEAKISIVGRNEKMQEIISSHLEHDLELLGLTGVEDKLQDDVKLTLEQLKNAGLKVWMLTGDKVETATNIAISTKLISRSQSIISIEKVQSVAEAGDWIESLRGKLDHCLVIDGTSLQYMTDNFKKDFIELSTLMPSVVCCRCSPTQKADVAILIKEYTKKTVCCIGDGGNDVSMIQAANIGVGIVGKEGMQASLAADVSVTQFSFLIQLLLWHGRNCYRQSAKLGHFIFHRGLIIASMQAIFSAIFYFAPISLYQGYLMIGYTTVYTMLPVFCLIFDRDLSQTIAILYPELYKDLVKGRSLSKKTFYSWLFISVFQGGAIMAMSIELFPGDFLHIVGISFTALVLNELIMVALQVTKWTKIMVISEVLSVFIYMISLVILKTDIDPSFAFTSFFWGRVTLITIVSTFPLFLFYYIKSKVSPPSSAKLSA